jgi:hypothetical protein
MQLSKYLKYRLQRLKDTKGGDFISFLVELESCRRAYHNTSNENEKVAFLQKVKKLTKN